MKRLLCVLIAILTFCGCNSSGEVKKEVLPLTLQAFSPTPFKIVTESSENEASEPDSTENSDETADNSPERRDYIPINYDIQKAVWFSYIDIAELLTGKTKDEFTSEISAAFSNVKELGANTVYVHVRPFGDALYSSEYFPASKYYTGAIGAYTEFDALEIMVGEGHKLGLSVHAWVNPLRCETEENIKKISEGYIIRQWYDDESLNGKYLVKNESDSRYWLNPAYEEVRTLVCNGVKEICLNYDVDGIHIDDYFYPTTEESFDKAAFAEVQNVSLSDFRLENTNKLVKGMYDTVKQVNSRLLFGISPQGNIDNNYSQLYADVKLWASEKGYCDYILPQVYYGFDNKTQPFEEVCKTWEDMTCNDVKLVIGLAFYKIYEGQEFENEKKIISRQIETVKEINQNIGIALYKYSDVFPTEKEKKNRAEPEREKIF